MFVSMPPQISADAAQTGFIGPSAPANTGSDGGFAAWLNGNAQASSDAIAAMAQIQGEAGTALSSQLPPVFAAPSSGQNGQPGQSGQTTGGALETSGAIGFQRAGGSPADMLLQASILKQAGAQGELQAGLEGGQKPGSTSGSTAAQSGAAAPLIKAGLLPAQNSATASQSSDADTADMALNRFGLPAVVKQATDALQKGAANNAADALGNRAGSETLSQSQTQLPTALQSTDSGFRSALSQTGLPEGGQKLGQNQGQGQGQNSAGRLNPSINSADIAVQMARNKADGKNQFTIRLTPESMGTITVKLNITNNSNLTAQLQVEKPETLALLQKDMAGLEKVLKAQGFTTSDGDLTIALKAASSAVRGAEAAMNSGTEQRFGQGQNQNQAQTQAQNPLPGSAAQSTPAQQSPTGAMDRPAPGMLLSSGDMGFQQSHQEHGAQGQDGFEQNPHGQAPADPDDLDPALMEQADLIANAYHGQNLLIGMSTQLDLSV